MRHWDKPAKAHLIVDWLSYIVLKKNVVRCGDQEMSESRVNSQLDNLLK